MLNLDAKRMSEVKQGCMFQGEIDPVNELLSGLRGKSCFTRTLLTASAVQN